MKRKIAALQLNICGKCIYQILLLLFKSFKDLKGLNETDRECIF